MSEKKAKNWALTVVKMQKALPLVQFFSTLLLKEEMTISVMVS